MTNRDAERGLYDKYNVERADGSSGPGGKHEHCDYFILDLVHDKLAVTALTAYAKGAEHEFPQLADDLYGFPDGCLSEYARGSIARRERASGAE